jgi:putative aldouronate transport system substrate-binding protein
VLCRGGGSVFSLLKPVSRSVSLLAAWQAVNKQLNANMQLRIVSPADYMAPVATVMAVGDPPDLLYFMTGTQVTPGLADYLKASFADLGPYIGGDAVKDYPNLAGLPASSWTLTRYNNSVYGVPLSRPCHSNVWFVNQTRFDAMGLTQHQQVIFNATDHSSLEWPMRPSKGWCRI